MRPVRDMVMRLFVGPDWKEKRAKKIAEKDELAQEQALSEKKNKKEAKIKRQDMDLTAVFKKE